MYSHVVITNQPHLIEVEQVGLNAGLSELLSGSAVAVSAPHVGHHLSAARPGPPVTSPWPRPVAPPWVLERKISRPGTVVHKKGLSGKQQSWVRAHAGLTVPDPRRPWRPPIRRRGTHVTAHPSPYGARSCPAFPPPPVAQRTPLPLAPFSNKGRDGRASAAGRRAPYARA